MKRLSAVTDMRSEKVKQSNRNKTEKDVSSSKKPRSDKPLKEKYGAEVKETVPARGGRRGRPGKQKPEKTKNATAKKPAVVDDIPAKVPGTKFVGAHCSIAGGVSNAVLEAASIGAQALGLFVRNGRTWKLGSLKEDEAEKFKVVCKEHGFSPDVILPHGSYLLNCGSSNPDVLSKTRDTLVHELQICEALGLTLYNFHPGSACGDGSVDECIQTIADSINLAHKQTKRVKTVIENMSCQGKTIGGKLEELRAIIDKVDDKSRIGVCLDTCHAFAAGFDLSTSEGFQKLMTDFEAVIGMQYLSGLHLNDSKGDVGCHLDRHENIGKGKIGLEGFRRIMNDPRLANLPMILETPVNDYAAEIKTLYSLESKAVQETL